ncbi:hypothetical protein B0H19DRAFT_127820 [Mycena capillaripes]|nr:hypothetical protein B0H19DRAFT_127820 [Mycena capillaripes]
MLPRGRREPSRGDTRAPPVSVVPSSHRRFSLCLAIIFTSPSFIRPVYIFHHIRCVGPLSVVAVVCGFGAMVSPPPAPIGERARVLRSVGVVEAAPPLTFYIPPVRCSSPSLVLRAAYTQSCTSTRPKTHSSGHRHPPPRHIRICTVYHQAETSIPLITTRTIATHPPFAPIHARLLILLYKLYPFSYFSFPGWFLPIFVLHVIYFLFSQYYFLTRFFWAEAIVTQDHRQECQWAQSLADRRVSELLERVADENVVDIS